MRFADAGVAALVKQDARAVAVVDHRIAHGRQALLPALAGHVGFRIAGGHGVHHAEPVERFNVLLPRRDVHPANQVGVAVERQAVAVVAQPNRYRHAERRPLVRRALGVAFHLDGAVIQLDHAAAELRLAETGAGSDAVDCLAVDLERADDVIQVAVAPTPETEALDGRAGFDHRRGARRQCLRRRPKQRHLFAAAVAHAHLVGEGAGVRILVAHFGFGPDRGAAGGDIEVARVDVHTGGAERRVQRQRLVQLVCHMQTHVLRQAAVVGVEVFVGPLEALAAGLFAVFPVVGGAHRHHVVAIDQGVRDVETESIDAVVVQADAFAVDEHFRGLARAFKFNEHLLAARSSRAGEMLAIPGNPGRMVDDVLGEGIVFVPGARQRHRFPRLIVEAGVGSVGRISHRQPPGRVEVVDGALGVGGHRCCAGEHGKDCGHGNGEMA